MAEALREEAVAAVQAAEAVRLVAEEALPEEAAAAVPAEEAERLAAALAAD